MEYSYSISCLQDYIVSFLACTTPDRSFRCSLSLAPMLMDFKNDKYDN